MRHRRSILAIFAAGATMACSLLTGAADLSIESEDGAIGDPDAPGEGSVPPGPPLDGGSDVAIDRDAGPARVSSGLLALYTFKEASGAIVHDVSGVAPALDLTIQFDGGAPTFGPAGLSIVSPSYIASPGPATKIIVAARASGEITLETWVTPANDTQGTARLCGVAGGYDDLDVTLDAVSKQYEGILRNGIPVAQYTILHTTGTTVKLAPTHVVLTRQKDNNRYLYVDGVELAHDAPVADFSTWNVTHPFTIANGVTLDLTWLGTVHLVAVYDRALTPAEVIQNFGLGP